MAELKDIFNINIPNSKAGENQIPSQSTGTVKTEAQTLIDKSLISFGTMAICIILFIVIAVVFKKRKKTQFTNKTIVPQQAPSNNADNKDEEYTSIQKNKKYLNTPSSIHNCIMSFLENTKEH